jgi:DNA primase
VSRDSETEELAEQLDLEYWLDRESRAFKKSRGASGMQLNPRECPACGDTRWRTYLNADTGRGNCFVCNQTFSKFGFIHRALGHDPDDKSPAGRHAWAETFKHVKEVLSEQGWRPVRKTLVAVEFGEVVLPASFELPTPENRNLVYLDSRGIDGDLARYFHLRYCVEGKFWFTKEDGTPGHQKFDGRVILPVFDLDGTLKTFQGRDVTGDPDVQKYLFPKGLPGTGRYLYNGQNANRARRICMGEGGFDVMAIKKAFDREPTLRDVVPVGSFGKHLSYGSADGDDQLGRLIQLKKDGLQEVTIMWDGEVKALESALNTAELVRKIDLLPRIALLPFERDPNEVIGQTVCEAFRNARIFTTALNIEWRLKNPYAAGR